MIHYSDNYFYYFWKKSGIASSWGQTKCFLDILKNNSNNNPRIKDIFKQLNEIFGPDKEYGLVNRLDNDTSGLLYFAKSQQVFQNYKELNQNKKIKKYYIADILGNISLQKNISIDDQKTFVIKTPIAHHRFLNNRMITTDNKLKHKNKIRGNIIDVETIVEFLYYDNKSNISTIKLTISKGCRHQIRCHLSSIGYPILGDKIYSKTNLKQLHLRSVGLKI